MSHVDRSPPIDLGGSHVSGYSVFVNGFRVGNVSLANQSHFQVTSLRESTLYAISVAGVNGVGEGQITAPLFVKTLSSTIPTTSSNPSPSPSASVSMYMGAPEAYLVSPIIRSDKNPSFSFQFYSSSRTYTCRFDFHSLD